MFDTRAKKGSIGADVPENNSGFAGNEVIEMAEVPPILLSAVICDKVIFDKMTGSPSLISIIQNINAPRYPVRYWQLVFFCELTNGHGTTNTKVRLVDEQEDEKVIFEQAGTVEFKDVKQIVTLAVNLQGMVFAHPGEYRFQLLAQEHLLGERRIICRLVQPPAKGGPGQPSAGAR